MKSDQLYLYSVIVIIKTVNSVLCFVKLIVGYLPVFSVKDNLYYAKYKTHLDCFSRHNFSQILITLRNSSHYFLAISNFPSKC